MCFWIKELLNILFDILMWRISETNSLREFFPLIWGQTESWLSPSLLTDHYNSFLLDLRDHNVWHGEISSWLLLFSSDLLLWTRKQIQAGDRWKIWRERLLFLNNKPPKGGWCEAIDQEGRACVFCFLLVSVIGFTLFSGSQPLSSLVLHVCVFVRQSVVVLFSSFNNIFSFFLQSNKLPQIATSRRGGREGFTLI